jgi:hypothetical protein
MAPKEVLATIYNDTLAQGICYLWSRWQDEQGYEDFKNYEQAMLEHVRKALPGKDVSLVRGTQEPWGIIFRMGGENHHLKLNIDMKKETYWLSVESGNGIV